MEDKAKREMGKIEMTMKRGAGMRVIIWPST
jgi:hypothetical protein